MNLPFPYIGSKKALMTKWSSLLPPHTLFVSVFGGSGADILTKPPSKIEVFNDLDDDINNVFRILRTQSEDLIRLITFTPAKSRATYEEALAMLHDPATDRLNRAWAFLVVAHHGYRGRHPRLHTNSGYAVLRSADRCIGPWLELPHTITQVVQRFQRVQIEQLDFRELIPRFDSPNTLFFVDPPYHPSTRSKRLYQHEMLAEDHIALLDVLNQVRGKVWLCGYSHAAYREKMRRWRRREFATYSPHALKSDRTEVVWTNFVPLEAA
jgi:DNA adenine methylase